jgi:hypothetical protein
MLKRKIFEKSHGLKIIAAGCEESLILTREIDNAITSLQKDGLREQNSGKSSIFTAQNNERASYKTK